jgi:hypothetical protein
MLRLYSVLRIAVAVKCWCKVKAKASAIRRVTVIMCRIDVGTRKPRIGSADRVALILFVLFGSGCCRKLRYRQRPRDRQNNRCCSHDTVLPFGTVRCIPLKSAQLKPLFGGDPGRTRTCDQQLRRLRGNRNKSRSGDTSRERKRAQNALKCHFDRSPDGGHGSRSRGCRGRDRCAGPKVPCPVYSTWVDTIGRLLIMRRKPDGLPKTNRPRSEP